jgi:putative ABC transport system ATP-binding protein
MGGSFIECISLNKQYGKNHIVHALKDIDLQIDKGEFVLLKGRSGAGKSTLLNLIGGLIKPTSGTIRIEDDIITDLNNDSLSRLLLNKIGIIFQNFNLLPTYSIFENIEVALAPLKLSRDETSERINPYFEQFNLQGTPDRMPEELSLGQQQKVAIIRTLVKQPSLILADEPTASVDDITAGEILNFLFELRKSKNVTVILATHGIVPDSFADRLIVLENGSIVR